MYDHDPRDPNIRLVQYKTTVVAIIRLDTKTVEDVRVIDEDIEAATQNHPNVLFADQMTDDNSPTRQQAIDIAESESWPRWRVTGWT